MGWQFGGIISHRFSELIWEAARSLTHRYHPFNKAGSSQSITHCYIIGLRLPNTCHEIWQGQQWNLSAPNKHRWAQHTPLLWKRLVDFSPQFCIYFSLLVKGSSVVCPQSCRSFLPGRSWFILQMPPCLVEVLMFLAMVPHWLQPAQTFGSRVVDFSTCLKGAICQPEIHLVCCHWGWKSLKLFCFIDTELVT